MRRLLCLLAITLSLTACSPAQLTRWLEWYAADPVSASRFADDYLSQRVELTAGRPCPEWFDLALEQGWEAGQWPTVARIMGRESRCDPAAHNRSGATGLMQVMPMWADDCGGAPIDLYDPAFNLACALHVLDVSGWTAWSTF